jgi:8-oxo-dGTP pyrophosphatase MutT (NUDIX family)
MGMDGAEQRHGSGLDAKMNTSPRGNRIKSTSFKKQVFSLISTVAFGAYGRFPVFGALRASVGIIRRGELFLAIERSDNQGYTFPGGLAFPGEKEERVLAREVHEETGLHVDHYRFVSRYFTRVPIPCNISVFEVEASGNLRDSWEGTPLWVDFAHLQSHIAASQRSIVEELL